MTLSKTWYTSANRAFDDFSTTNRTASSALFALKAFLKGEITGTAGAAGQPPASSYWTCTGSSDSSTAGIDNTDRLGSSYNSAKWVRAAAGVAHTWIVLKSPTTMLDQPWYLLIDWGTASDQNCNLYISKTAFTGGSTTARPTATAEHGYVAVTFIESTTSACKSHYCCDANGSFWFLLSRNSTSLAQTCIGFNELVEGRSSGDAARGALYHSNNTSAPGVPNISATGTTVRGCSQSGTAAAGTLGLLNPAFNTTAWTSLATGTNSIDAKIDALPIAYIYDSTASNIGIRGRFPDVWYVGGQVANASTEPSTGTQTRSKIGSALLPFDVPLSI